ncbi:hypothetical protein HK096_002602, partial [Nowakowskiella sp. JEL0078]
MSMKTSLTKTFQMTSNTYDKMVEELNIEMGTYKSYFNGIAVVCEKSISLSTNSAKTKKSLTKNRSKRVNWSTSLDENQEQTSESNSPNISRSASNSSQ